MRNNMWCRENYKGEIVTWYSEAEVEKYRHALINIKRFLDQYMTHKPLRVAIEHELKSTGINFDET